MMYWLRLSTLILAICSIVIPPTSIPAIAQVNQTQSKIGAVKVPADGVGKLVGQLNLSTDQIQRLEKLRTNSKAKTRQRRAALRAAKQELAQLLQGTGSSDQIRQKRQQVQLLQREISDLNFENTLAIREILLPEQRAKLQQIIQQRQKSRTTLGK